ncbi:MAG: putative selenate ABC transporter substrate-binding protein [Gemmatimonadetes bacterium]|nr:putative selenate ABC transporter substrate-binding protein [Gemmatimonadota bacterium]
MPKGFLTAGAVLLAVAGCAPPSEEGAAVLRFSAIPDDNTTELRRKYDPVAAYLSQQLGVPVQYVPAADYGASVEMFKNGDVQLAWFGGLTGVQARQAVPGAHAIAQGVEDPQYYSYFIANPASGLEPSDDFPEEIADARFTFGSTKSTSGRLMPEYFIRVHSGKSPADFFRHEYGFSGSHDQTIEQVAGGAFDAGAVSYKTFDAKIAEGKVDPEQVRVIWKTPAYADYNFTAHPVLETTFGAGFTERLRKTLLDMKDPELLAGFRRAAFIPAEDSEYDDILDVARQLDMAR